MTLNTFALHGPVNTLETHFLSMQKYSIPIFWWHKMDWMFLWKIQISVQEKDTILLYVANNLLASSVRSAVWSYHTIKINANEYIILHTNNWVLRICFGLNSSEEIQTLVSIPTCCVIWIWLNASNFSVYWGVAAQKKKTLLKLFKHCT